MSKSFDEILKETIKEALQGNMEGSSAPQSDKGTYEQDSSQFEKQPQSSQNGYSSGQSTPQSDEDLLNNPFGRDLYDTLESMFGTDDSSQGNQTATPEPISQSNDGQSFNEDNNRDWDDGYSDEGAYESEPEQNGYDDWDDGYLDENGYEDLGEFEPIGTYEEPTPIPMPEPVQPARTSQTDVFNVNPQDLTNELNNIRNTVMNSDEYRQQPNFQKMQQQATRNAMNNPTPQENVNFQPNTSTFMGQSFQYTQNQTAYNPIQTFERSTIPEETAISFDKVCESIMADIQSKFGTWDRIASFAVVDARIIINGVSYEPILPQSFVRSLPWDVQRSVADGAMAWLFKFKVLRQMKNLSALMFSDVDFVYSKVRKDLGIQFDFTPAYFFKICKHLMNLQIGNTCITASNPKVGNDMFKRASRVEEIYNGCCNVFDSGVVNSWGRIKSAYQDPNRSGLSKAMGIVWNSTVAVGAAMGSIGTRATGLVGKLGKGLINFASSLKESRK